jgi:hypothetical protein
VEQTGADQLDGAGFGSIGSGFVGGVDHGAAEMGVARGDFDMDMA